MPTREVEQKVEESLLLFVDFLYAIVFGLIISEVFEKIIVPSQLTFSNLAVMVTDILTVMMVFYFLTWDWIHARILTIRNPHKGYTRFFIEVTIAVCAYGTATQALNKSLSLLLYVGLILILGALWAKKTLRDYPGSADQLELKTIQTLQSVVGMIVLTTFLLLYFVLHITSTNSSIILIVLFLWWLFLLFYEMGIPRVAGVASGPGVPFLSRRDVRKIRGRFSVLTKWLSQRKEKS